ncbi:hypothetical protein BDN72DRAFT_100447 [Pluteus cervinus]|uniref:Uncharacterized protein n=1 Tax=Pluteus cervinus TaxID=181527 RepID=A0ACD3B8E9_9AGAR|nr:hypothetical protein BDN72DRAFT_100447 [Pluteus cervinus]
MIIPPELVDIILRDVCAGEHPQVISSTLYNSSLVCKCWRGIAQPLLFSEPSLARRSASTSTSLLVALSKYPHLRGLIKILWLDYNTFWLWPRYRNLLFELLPGLQSLVLAGFHWPIPHEIFAALQSTFSSDRITRLYLSHMTKFPVALFYHFSTLRELYLRKVTFEGFRVDTGDLVQKKTGGDSSQVDARLHSRGKQLRLEHLSLFYREITEAWIIKWLLNPSCAFDTPLLKSLHLYHPHSQPDSINLVNELLRSTSPFVEVLEWTFPGRFDNVSHFQQKSPCPTLMV